jgi:hypothetical protein
MYLILGPTGWPCQLQSEAANLFPPAIIAAAIKYVQCGHITYRRGGFAAAAHRNHPFNELSHGSKPAS